MAEITKRLVYQQADWLNPTTITLEEAIRQAFSRVAEPDRQQPISPDASPTTGTWRKLTYGTRHTEACYGKLVVFTHGMRQETVRIQRRQGEPLEGAVEAPAGQEFSDSSLYFCISRNHVVVAQSQGLRIGQLEEFLNWFLITRAQVIPENNGISLRSVPAREAREMLARSTLKSITIGRPIELPNAAFIERHRTISAGTATITALEKLLNINNLRNMLPRDALEGGRIKTQITLSWNKRVGGERPDQFLQGFGRVLLRQMDEDPSAEVAIETSAGRLTNRKFSLAESVRMSAPDGVLPSGTVFRSMANFLTRLHSRGEIVG